MLSIDITHEIEKHLAPHIGAVEFLKAFSNLCHMVDDLIDRDNPAIRDYRLLALDTYCLAAEVYSCDFYAKHRLWLFPVVMNVHRVYSDSVVWEKSEIEWRRQYADALRCCGSEVLMAILHHLCHISYSDLRRISQACREDIWEKSHDSEGRPV